jgi:hypothetical protein
MSLMNMAMGTEDGKVLGGLYMTRYTIVLLLFMSRIDQFNSTPNVLWVSTVIAAIMIIGMAAWSARHDPA